MTTSPEMPCEFHAFDGCSTLEERQAAWVERLQRAFPGAYLVDDDESEAA